MPRAASSPAGSTHQHGCPLVGPDRVAEALAPPHGGARPDHTAVDLAGDRCARAHDGRTSRRGQVGGEVVGWGAAVVERTLVRSHVEWSPLDVRAATALVQ